jgi:hypothetical protein
MCISCVVNTHKTPLSAILEYPHKRLTVPGRLISLEIFVRTMTTIGNVLDEFTSSERAQSHYDGHDSKRDNSVSIDKTISSLYLYFI